MISGAELLFDSLFVSGAGFEPDGGADESEGFAYLVGEEALEGEVEFDVLVGEEDEGGWGDGGLGHVVNPDAAVHGDGRALEVDLGEEAVHLAGGDALAALAGVQFDFLEEAFDAFAGGGGEEDERGVVEVLEVVADLLLVDALVDLGSNPPFARSGEGWATRICGRGARAFVTRICGRGARAFVTRSEE